MADARDGLTKRWWRDWQAKDYSWEGLSLKAWDGWLWSPRRERAYHQSNAPKRLKLIPATLQHFWWSEKDSLLTSPDGTETFTIVHLPIFWASGEATQKAAYGERFQDAVRKLLEQQIEQKAQLGDDARGDIYGHTLIVEGAVFVEIESASEILALMTEGDIYSIDLSRCFIPALRTGTVGRSSIEFDITCSDCLFDESVFVNNVTFNGQIEMYSCIISQLHTDGVHFSQRIALESSVVLGMSWFRGAEFAGSANFSDTIFASWVNFEGCIFRGHASFDDATFLKNANFSRSIFCERALFEGAAFAGNANFVGAAFSSVLDISGAYFEKDAQFSGESPPISSDTEPLNLKLNQSRENGGGRHITGTITKSDKDVRSGSRVLDSIYGNDAIFCGIADFMSRDVTRPSIFEGAAFLGRVLFHGSKLNQRTGFHGARFLTVEACLCEVRARTAARRFKTARRQVAKVLGPNSARLLRRRPKLRRVGTMPLVASSQTLRRSPWPAPSLQLLNATRKIQGRDALHELSSAERVRVWGRWQLRTEHLRSSQLGTIDDRHFEKIEASFRTLKQAMEESRSRLSEGQFFRLELRARRERRDKEVRLWERGFSILYAVMSDYGNSATRPMAAFVVAFLAFAALYFVRANLGTHILFDPSLPVHPDVWQALRFSGSRMLPFGAFEVGAPWEWRAELLSNSFEGLLSRILATLQSTIAIILTFLFALSIRRRFQIT